jgi:ribosomal protein S18 acetylase RimI-like enzyme
MSVAKDPILTAMNFLLESMSLRTKPSLITQIYGLNYMHTYTLNGRNFIINELTIADALSGELLAIDSQYYSPNIAWSKDKWQSLLSSATYKLAVREITETGSLLIGNMVVSVASGRYSARPNSSSYYINSLTIHIDCLRQGHAKHLTLELKNMIQDDPESKIENLSVFVPRNRPTMSRICEDYGFTAYEVARNNIRYTIAVKDFCAMIDYKIYASRFTANAESEQQSSRPRANMSLKC